VVLELIADKTACMVACMVKPFEIVEPSPCHYHPVEDSCLSFCPNLPKIIGHADYAADSTLSKCEPNECRKYAGHHPVLTPGISTTFCPHGICYGFEIMASHKSPCHPFQIFRSRFAVAPKLIIYEMLANCISIA